MPALHALIRRFRHPAGLAKGVYAVAILLALSTAPLAAAAPSVKVSAQAEVKMAPDKATLTARLWEHTAPRADDEPLDSQALQKARERLETRAKGLMEAMDAIGIAKDAINAGTLSVRPERTHASRQTSSDPQVRTRLSRPFTIEITDLARLIATYDALTDTGVNALDDVRFDLQEGDAATDQALTQALEKAYRKAALMARTLDATLGPVLSIEETRTPGYQPRRLALQASRDSQGGSPTSEYRPGQIRIEASVSVSWELIPAPYHKGE